jgi:hypothetical protein
VRALRFLASVALLVVLGGGMRADAQLSAQDQALFNAINANKPVLVKRDPLQSPMIELARAGARQEFSP